MAVLPIGIGSAGGIPANAIDRSLRFNSADSAYLNRTPASVSADRTRFTFSCWLKRGSLTDSGVTLRLPVFGAGPSSGQYTQIATADGSGALKIELLHDGAVRYSTLAVLRDPSAWCHLVVQGNSNETVTNRIKIWVNNVQYTTSVVSEITSGDVFEFGNTVAHYVGKFSWASYYFDGYLTEINFIDGQALTPSSFGETDSNTGVWKPKAYSGTYGTNGFYLNFADNSGTTSTTLGKDYSGNGNNWTPNNFSVTAGAGNDSLVDSPTSYGTDTGAGGEVRGNYCTLNPLDNSLTLANGNLDASRASASWASTRSTFNGITSGKWYWECSSPSTISGTNYPIVGVAWNKQALSSYCGQDAFGYGCGFLSGQKWNNAVNTNYGSAFATNDVMGIAFDADNGKIWFSKNGTFFASGDPVAGTNAAFTGITGQEYSPTFSLYGTNIIINTNFGQRPFAYTAPSGFKALCTQNLPTPTIGATSTTQAGKYFNVRLYNGNGNTGQTITGVGFQPDFTWLKNRNQAGGYYHSLFDAVRGAGYRLKSNAADAEANATAIFSAFTSDGFTFPAGQGNTIENDSAGTYASWNWNAGGSTVTNTTGSISAQVRANTTSGFSIVTWTGQSSGTATIGHGLGVAPDMVIMKIRSGSTSDWEVYHKNLTSAAYTIRLQSTAAQASAANVWNSTTPTSTVFSVGSTYASGGAGYGMVAYCFAPVAGYSAFGSYTGNGSTDGPFVYLGFRPRFLLLKISSTTGNWAIYDTSRNTYNVMDLYLYPNSSAAEGGSGTPRVDALSNGFKLRNSGQDNTSSATYIYAAFAETPAKFSLAR